MSMRKSSRVTHPLTIGQRPGFNPGINRSDNYQPGQTGLWRHSFSTNTPNQGSSALLTGEYMAFTLLQFQRTFDVGVTNDVPPTATASNNYQSIKVFNGSKVSNFQAVFRLVNTGASLPANLDVYTIALSFYDALVWNTVLSANCPVTFNTTGGAGDNRGFVDWKTMTATIITDNQYKSFRFIQHFMKKLGTITIGNSDTDNEVVFTLNRVPGKCVRSQTGMFYGIVFHNEASKNNGQTVNINPFMELSFVETPSENRLPYNT